MDIPLEPVVALIAGILIFLIPRLLNYIVASYLVVIGLMGVFSTLPRTPVTASEARLTSKAEGYLREYSLKPQSAPPRSPSLGRVELLVFQPAHEPRVELHAS